MTEANATRSPLEAAAEVAGPRAIEAFALLGNETRLAILLALWEAYEPFPGGEWDPTGGNAMPVSELQDRVGIDDSDDLADHLAKLEGQFVERDAGGFYLLTEGKNIVQNIIATVGLEEPGFEETDVDLDCWLCGAPSAITYQDGRIYHVCTQCEGGLSLGKEHPSGVLNAWKTNPTALHGRSPEEIFEATFTDLWYAFDSLIGGICPECSGKVEISTEPCDDHNPVDDEPCPACGRVAPAVARFVCTSCKQISQSDFDTFAHFHPAVVGFAWKYGIELGYGIWDSETVAWLQHLWDDVDEEVVSTEPVRVRVTFGYEDDEVQLTFDDELDVVSVNENY